MNSDFEKHDFNPSGVGLKNGNFIGLPFSEETAKIILVPVPWDVTVSYEEGTANAPQAILDASVQLDLYDPDISDAWKLGIFMQQSDEFLMNNRINFRVKSAAYIDFLEKGGTVSENPEMKNNLDEINGESETVNQWVFGKSKKLMKEGKIVGIIGGEHSVPLGYLQALSELHSDFGILQIDAHMDLRNSYEGFTHSHASVFNNALKLKSVSKLVQVGIRDFCDEEMEMVHSEKERISVFFDQQLKENRFSGMTWNEQCGSIINQLPENVYVSFDIDGLDPKLCPNTGTPVPGGLDFYEVNFLLKKLVESGRKIIGFDLCEVGNNEWDANVGARILYKLCNWTGRSQKLI